MKKVYRDAWRAAEEGRCDHVMKGLFHYYSEHPGEMPNEFLLIGYREGMDRAVCDFLSCMTDRYAVRQYRVTAVYPRRLPPGIGIQAAFLGTFFLTKKEGNFQSVAKE